MNDSNSENNNQKLRTRFCPSPTGFMHVGGVRSAIFDYLLAKKTGGEFILRTEDTDKKREVQGAKEHALKSLEVMGITPDESYQDGGEYGPYVQSERTEIYKFWAQKLVDMGRAYVDNTSTEDLQKLREEAQKNKVPFLYRNYRPENTPEWDGTQTLRFKSEPKAYTWSDEVMGELSSKEESIDDFIIMKSDGLPTYNFAHIVDDYEMKISVIIRGQEFLSSVPNYLNLYEALGIKKPLLATVPHILAPSGGKKLSKRDGARDVLSYIDEGYLPEALLSFIVTMGWNDGTEQEVFTHDELVEKFSLSQVGKSGARFDEKRLLWVNGMFIRELSIEELYEKSKNFLPESANNYDQSYIKKTLSLMQERLKTLKDLEGVGYFFEKPKENLELLDNKQLKKVSDEEKFDILKVAKANLDSVQNWNTENIQQALNKTLDDTGQKAGIVFSLVRIYTTWAPFSPQLPETLELLGKENTLDRL